MPKKLHKRAEKYCREKGYKGERLERCTYGTLNKMMKNARKGRRKKK